MKIKTKFLMNSNFFKDIKIFSLKSYFLKSFISNVKGDETYRAYGDIMETQDDI